MQNSQMMESSQLQMLVTGTLRECRELVIQAELTVVLLVMVCSCAMKHYLLTNAEWAILASHICN